MKRTTIYIIVALLTVAAVAWLWFGQSTDSNDTNQNVASVNQSNGGDASVTQNINGTQDEIVLSEKRATAPTEPIYEEGGSGQQCWVFDLNDYIPTKDEIAKTYTWIIEIPDDDCVIGKSATNLSETLGESVNENIKGTNYRRIIVSYQ